MAEDSDQTYLESAEQRFTAKLQQVVRDTAAADPTPPPAEESPIPTEQQQQQQPNSEQSNEQVNSKTPTTRTPYRSLQQLRKKPNPPKSTVRLFHTLPQEEQEKQLTESQARLGPDYNFKTHSRYRWKQLFAHLTRMKLAASYTRRIRKRPTTFCCSSDNAVNRT